MMARKSNKSSILQTSFRCMIHDQERLRIVSKIVEIKNSNIDLSTKQKQGILNKTELTKKYTIGKNEYFSFYFSLNFSEKNYITLYCQIDSFLNKSRSFYFYLPLKLFNVLKIKLFVRKLFLTPENIKFSKVFKESSVVSISTC